VYDNASATNYVQVTANSSYTIVGTPATGDGTIPYRVKFSDSTDNSVAHEPIVHRISVSVKDPMPEFEADEPPAPQRPLKKIPFRSPTREIVAPWNAKWRLTQQRPRDGLR